MSPSPTTFRTTTHTTYPGTSITPVARVREARPTGVRRELTGPLTRGSGGDEGCVERAGGSAVDVDRPSSRCGSGANHPAPADTTGGGSFRIQPRCVRGAALVIDGDRAARRSRDRNRESRMRARAHRRGDALQPNACCRRSRKCECRQRECNEHEPPHLFPPGSQGKHALPSHRLRRHIIPDTG
jgi:hypothetical protein